MYKEVKCERSNLNIIEFLPNIDFRVFLKNRFKAYFFKMSFTQKIKIAFSHSLKVHTWKINIYNI